MEQGTLFIILALVIFFMYTDSSNSIVEYSSSPLGQIIWLILLMYVAHINFIIAIILALLIINVFYPKNNPLYLTEALTNMTTSTAFLSDGDYIESPNKLFRLIFNKGNVEAVSAQGYIYWSSESTGLAKEAIIEKDTWTIYDKNNKIIKQYGKNNGVEITKIIVDNSGNVILDGPDIKVATNNPSQADINSLNIAYSSGANHNFTGGDALESNVLFGDSKLTASSSLPWPATSNIKATREAKNRNYGRFNKHKTFLGKYCVRQKIPS